MTTPLLPVYVLAASSQTLERLHAAAFTHVSLRAFASAGELLERCRIAPPLLVVAEVCIDTDLTPLAHLAELPASPRRLYLVEPVALEELMSEAFRLGADHAQLWPCSPEELRAALAHALNAVGGSDFPLAIDLDTPPL